MLICSPPSLTWPGTRPRSLQCQHAASPCGAPNPPASARCVPRRRTARRRSACSDLTSCARSFRPIAPHTKAPRDAYVSRRIAALVSSPVGNVALRSTSSGSHAPLSHARTRSARPSRATATASRCRRASAWSSAPASSASAPDESVPGGCRRAGGALLQEHRGDSRRGGLTLEGHRPHQRLSSPTASISALHGGARQAVRRSAARLDADDRFRLRPAGVQGRGRSHRGGAGVRSSFERSTQATPALGANTGPRSSPRSTRRRRSPSCRSRRSSSTGRICPSAPTRSIVKGMLTTAADPAGRPRRPHPADPVGRQVERACPCARHADASAECWHRGVDRARPFGRARRRAQDRLRQFARRQRGDHGHRRARVARARTECSA